MAAIQQDFSLPNQSNYTSERFEPGLPSSNAKRLAKGLGWFSLALGTTEQLAPKFIVRISGVSVDLTGLIRLDGLRDIAYGIVSFAQNNPARALGSRVEGDAKDV